MMFINEDSNSQLLSEDVIPLKGRSREIYLELCKYIDNLPRGCSLPSLRELQKKYSAGQQTIVNALKLLNKNKKVTKTSQKKIKVSSDVSTAKTSTSPAFTGFPWAFERNSADVVMTTVRGLAAIWQPIVDKFNNNNSRRIRLHTIDSFDDFFPSRERMDFMLFPSNPISLGLVRDTSMFMDMDSLSKSLDECEIVPSAFVSDPNGRMWGMAPVLSPAVIFRNTSFDKSLDATISLNWNFSDFGQYLEQLRKKFPQLPYIHSFCGYISFLFHNGVSMIDQNTGKIKLDPESMVESLEFLNQLAAKKIIPLYSDVFENNNSVRMFNQAQLVTRDGWSVEIGEILKAAPEVNILPVPTKKGQQRVIYSDIFCIMSDSLNYDTCWQFIQYALSTEIQQHLAQNTGHLPVRKGIIPKNISQDQFEFLSQYVAQCVRRPEDYFLPFQSAFVIEAGIDRWIKHGGKLRPLLNDLEKSCQWHIDNIVWSKWK